MDVLIVRASARVLAAALLAQDKEHVGALAREHVRRVQLKAIVLVLVLPVLRKAIVWAAAPEHAEIHALTVLH